MPCGPPPEENLANRTDRTDIPFSVIGPTLSSGFVLTELAAGRLSLASLTGSAELSVGF